MPDYLPHYSKRHSQELLKHIPSRTLADRILKAGIYGNPLGNSSDYDSPKNIQNEIDWEEAEQARRAIWPESNYFNTLGMPRPNFVKSDNDDLAENAYYAVCEKSILDYLSTLEWSVYDKREEEVDDAVEFLRRPNPQQYFDDYLRGTCRDLLRYDAGAAVKTFRKKGTIVEFKPYLGTEFWAEIDRKLYSGHTAGLKFTGWYSKGYVVHWWQRSRTGLYISFVPDEVSYMRMYQPSDSIYGTDFISRLKWQIQYLIDSTRAAGKTFQNGVVPSIVWRHPQVFTERQLAERMKEVATENKGSYNFGSILHLVREEEVSTLSHTLHDMEWLEGQKFVAQLVWSMFGFQPEEFSGQSVNRATAYISRNVTKSKMLYPLIKFYEKIINNDILPKVEGYNNDWRFKFSIEMDLDDELKQAQILATKVQTANMLHSIGVKAEDCLRVAKVTDIPETLAIEDIPIQMDTTPKQPVGAGNKYGAVQGSQHIPQKKIPFGDQEERQAGIKKSSNKNRRNRNDKISKANKR